MDLKQIISELIKLHKICKTNNMTNINPLTEYFKIYNTLPSYRHLIHRKEYDALMEEKQKYCIGAVADKIDTKLSRIWFENDK